MDTDVEQLLREGMLQLAAVTTAPAGLLGRARRRLRRRRLAMISTAGAAAITAVAVVTVALAGGPAGTVSRAQTIAYVTGRVDNAVTALATANLVLRTEITFGPAFPAITQWNYRQDVRTVQSGLMYGTGLPWAQGRVSFAVGSATVGGKRTYVQADFRHHQWYPMPALAAGAVPNACTARPDLAEFNSVDWPGYIRQTLACGKFKIAGHAWINGKKIIKITGSMTEPTWWPSSPHAAGHGIVHVDTTLYVDPSTYLPVRAVWINSSHAADGRLLRGTVRQDFLTLPPTPGNIAKATITIPAGFRKVHRFAFGGPVGRFFG